MIFSNEHRKILRRNHFSAKRRTAPMGDDIAAAVALYLPSPEQGPMKESSVDLITSISITV